MKTAISIEAPLLEETDRTARKLGLSRSRVVSLALADYLRHQRNQQIVEQLNHVYAESGALDKSLAAKLKDKFRSTVKDRW